MRETIVTVRLPATALLFVIIGTSVTVAADAIIFKKVDFFEMRGDDEKKWGARLELDPEAKILTLADEKSGIEKATYAVIPYSQIKKNVYERSSHRRYKSGLFLTPWLLFSKGKKHWLTIEFAFASSSSYPRYIIGFMVGNTLVNPFSNSLNLGGL